MTSQPTLPFELIEEEILCRLPVKFLVQLRCICKSWNSLISHPKFARKHLRLSKRHHLIASSKTNLNEHVFLDSPISSVFSTSRAPEPTQLSYPFTSTTDTYRGCPRWLSSCDGILCFTISDNSAVLWNPSIRKFKILPPLERLSSINPFENQQKGVSFPRYSFGYDHFIDNYKIFGIIQDDIDQNEVSVLTLGADHWRRIQDLPYRVSIYGQGIFVSGTVNWSTIDRSSSRSSFRALISLDLEKESFQKLQLPDLEKYAWTLGLLRDCLCIFAKSNEFLDIWIMKEYGNKESWDKLYTVSQSIDQGLGLYIKTLYVSEDGKMLLVFDTMKLFVYDSKNDTFNIPEIQKVNRLMDPQVYIESLISLDS